MIKLRILMGDDTELTMWAKCNQKRLYIKKEGKSELERDWKILYCWV